SAADRNALHVHGLAGTNVLIEEASVGVGVSEDITANSVIAQGDGGSGRAIIDLIYTCGGHGQGAGGDIGGGGGGIVNSIISSVSAADRDALHVHGFACANVLIAEASVGVGVREDIIANAAIAEGHAEGGT